MRLLLAIRAHLRPSKRRERFLPELHRQRPAAVATNGQRLPCRRGPPPMSTPYAFDDDGNPVATVDFAYPDDAPEADTRGDTLAALVEFLRQLTEDDGQPLPALLAGQRLHLLAFLAGASDCQTQRQLATRLNVSAGRVSQILASLPTSLRCMARLKRRAAKRPAIGNEPFNESHRGDKRQRPASENERTNRGRF